MTAEAERRVPEHPGLRSWWLRYAEYDGRKVVLTGNYSPSTRSRMDCAYAVWWMSDGRTWLSPLPQGFDDLAEAEAAFELACERLREGA